MDANGRDRTRPAGVSAHGKPRALAAAVYRVPYKPFYGNSITQLLKPVNPLFAETGRGAICPDNACRFPTVGKLRGAARDWQDG